MQDALIFVEYQLKISEIHLIIYKIHLITSENQLKFSEMALVARADMHIVCVFGIIIFPLQLEVLIVHSNVLVFKFKRIQFKNVHNFEKKNQIHLANP